MNPDELEILTLTLDVGDLIKLLMQLKLLYNEYSCPMCITPCKYVKYERNIDKHAWRCMNVNCNSYKKYYSLRTSSFFDGFRIELKYIMRILIKYMTRTPRFAIIKSLNISKLTILKVISKLVLNMPKTDFSNSKLGGPGLVVQIDETMLNFKCKSHRGRSPHNRTDSICMVEVSSSILRAFACVIENKKIETILPLILEQVAIGSQIWTDEHKSYSGLNKHGYIHKTVCHKRQFVSDDGTNTQAVESFNNLIKKEIKSRMGVETTKRGVFLKEVCFLFNNSKNIFAAIMDLIKIN